MSKPRLEALTEKRDQINAQIQAVKNKAQVQQRNDETRRKILIGGVILKRIKDGLSNEEELMTWLNEGLTKDNERALFSLAPLGEKNNQTADLKK